MCSYDYPTLGDTMPHIMYMGHNPDKCIKEIPYNWRMYFESEPESVKAYMRCIDPPAQKLTDINQPAQDDDDYEDDRLDISLFAVDDDVIRPGFPRVAYPKMRIILNKHRDDKEKMAVEVHKFLCFALSPDGKVRTEAECRLGQLQKQNLSDFLLSLSLELSSDSKPLESRKLAGILLKNSLDAKEHLWVSNDVSLKSEIKGILLNTLGSSVSEAGHTAAQVIAKIASIEIPRKEWPELIASLLGNVTEQGSPTSLKQATFEAIGYICEEISRNDLVQDDIDSLLTAIVQGMDVGEHPYVRLTATSALLNALDFAQNEKERHDLIRLICVTTMAEEVYIRVAAFKCLASVALTYYDVLQFSHSMDLFNLTLNAVRRAEQGVALEAIQFWSSVCDNELKLRDFHSCEGSDSHPSLIKASFSWLVPMLLETLLKRDEDQEDCISSLSMAGGTCLGLVSRIVGDEVVPLVMSFVQGSLSRSDWWWREAAARAFASILEGSTVENLYPMVSVVLDFLLNAMRDQNTHVRDTTSFTLCRIFELLHSPATGFSVISADNVQHIMVVLLECIKDSPEVAEKVCAAIYYLANSYEGFETGSSVLAPYLADIITSLIATANRRDINNTKLRSDAYETLNAVVRCCNIVESSQIITTQLLPVIMTKLGQTFESRIMSSNDREKQEDMQVLLSGVMPVIIQKLSSRDEIKPDILQAADQIMTLFLNFFSSGSSRIHEEAMLAIGVLANATGPEFAKYLPVFYKYLETGLQNLEVCSISFKVVGDICRALGEKMLPYCDSIMSLLLKDLSSTGALQRSVTPLIFSCFSEVALAIGRHFDKYIPNVMPMIQSAEQMCSRIDVKDEATVKHRDQLIISIFRAYSGILRGFDRDRDRIRLPLYPLILFIEEVVMDSHRDEGLVRATIAVLGDLAGVVFCPDLKDDIKDFFGEFLQECLQSKDQDVEKIARFITSEI